MPFLHDMTVYCFESVGCNSFFFFPLPKQVTSARRVTSMIPIGSIRLSIPVKDVAGSCKPLSLHIGLSKDDARDSLSFGLFCIRDLALGREKSYCWRYSKDDDGICTFLETTRDILQDFLVAVAGKRG
jgi:hypothetical protein